VSAGATDLGPRSKDGTVADGIFISLEGGDGGGKTTQAALLPAAIALEWPVGEGVNEIKTIVNEEHTLIMTREVSIEEGLAAMKERAAEFIK
jgi:multiple sugar transport system substrate-binding protein